MKEATLEFWGAAGCVTGSKFLLETENNRILIDCGLFQGLKENRKLNRSLWPRAMSEIDAVVLTHGHLDHVGMLPRMVKDGFNGPIYGTAPTLEVARIILEDSAEIQVEEANRAAQEGYSKYTNPEPLYTPEDVKACLQKFKAIGLDQWHTVGTNLKFRYRYNGHILGAAFIEFQAGQQVLVFSGDIGRQSDLLMYPPERPEQADVLILESTYGNRLHPDLDLESELASEILEAIRTRGTCIIPSFAVERLQTVMVLLWQLKQKNIIPANLPIYVDSPMGAEVWNLFSRFPDWHRIRPEQVRAMRNAMTLITDYRDTWSAIDDTRPKIVVAGSGMLSGGRVLTYLSQLLDKPETRIVLVGYQAEGTRGRNLMDGAHELKIFGKYIPVKAHYRNLEALSAHADQSDLLWWMSQLKSQPQKVFLVHGEATAQDALRVKIHQDLGWEVQIPKLYETVHLSSKATP
ncbi:MAG: hypothetical protein RLZZ241_1115 [Bacteroidota bacterium]|jgi:metallo-beta-lactamase family protein